MPETITVKQLADKARVDPKVIRRVLRSQFPRDSRVKSYEWSADNPELKLILKAVEKHKQTK